MPFVPALAVSIGGAVAGAATWLTSTALGTTLLQFGFGIAAKYLASRLQLKPKAQATQLETRYGEDLERTVGLGLYATAGHHIYRNAYGKGNSRIQDVFVISHFRITGVPRVRYKGEWQTLPVDDPASQLGAAVPNSKNRIFVKVFYGTMDQLAAPNLVQEAKPAGRWTANHRGAGVAYVVVTNLLDREDLSSPAELLFEVKGAPCYDWRKDSSVGGAGAHRWANQNTWEYSDNPAVQAYNLERGFFNGAELMVGKGVSPSRLPLSEWTLAANICDETLSDGKRYRSALIASAGDGATHAANMEPLMEAMAAAWYEGAAGEFPIAGANQAVSFTFTDADLYADKDRRFSKYRPRDQLINFVAGNYPDPESFYESKAFTPKTVAALVAQDRERKAVSISYDAVPFVECVDRLADIALRANRYQANGEVCIHPRFLAVKPGQWVRWNSKRFGDRKYQVMSKRLGPMGRDAPRAVYLSLQEVGDGIFDPTQFQTVPVIPMPQGAAEYLTELQNYFLGQVVLQSETGSKRPALRATWDAIDDPTIVSVEFQQRPKAQPTAVQVEAAPADDNSIILSKGMLSDSDWEVRYRLRARPARLLPWTQWVTIKTPSGKLGPADVLLEALAIPPEFREIAKANWAAMQGALDELERLNSLVATQDAGNFRDKQTLRQELQSSTGDLTAKFTDMWTVATSATEALASRVQVAETALDGKASTTALSALESRTSAAEGKIDTNGTAITAINAALPGKASTTALSALEGRVTSAEGSITSQGQAITGLQTSLALKANASAVTQLTTRVSDVEGQVSSQASALTAVDARVDNATASALLRMVSVAGPSGWSRISFQTKTGTGTDGFGISGLFLESRATGGNRLVLQADRTTFINNDGDVVALFGGGGAYFNTAYIQNLTAASITLNGITYDRLASKSVTQKDRLTGYNSSGSNGSYQTAATITILNPDAAPVYMDWSLQINGQGPTNSNQSGELRCRLRCVTTGEVLAQNAKSYAANQGGTSVETGFLVHDTSPAGSVTYVIEYLRTNMSTIGSNGGLVKMIWWNR